jgi:hypothetical protein
MERFRNTSSGLTPLRLSMRLRAGAGVLAFVLMLGVESAAAECRRPAAPVPVAGYVTAIATASGESRAVMAGELTLIYEGASGPFLETDNLAQFEAWGDRYRQGLGPAPRYVADPETLPEENGMPILDLGGLADPAAQRRQRVIAALRNMGVNRPGQTLLVSGLSAPQPPTLEHLDYKPSVAYIVGGDESAPPSMFQPVNAPGNGLGGPANYEPDDPFQLVGAPSQTLPYAAIRMQDAVVLIEITGQLPCNGVHIGGGRVLTNLHCANTSAARQVFFGAPFIRNGARQAPLMCSARAIYPRDPTSTAARRLDIAVLQLDPDSSGLFLSDAFVFKDRYVTLGRYDAWADPSVRPALISAQIRRGEANGSETLEQLLASGEWANSSCRAGQPPPEEPRRTRHACVIQPGERDYRWVSDAGAPHGCDGETSSSGMPLLIKAPGGDVVLAGLHSRGRGNDLGPTGPLRENWNCAVSARQIADAITQDTTLARDSALVRWATTRR